MSDSRRQSSHHCSTSVTVFSRMVCIAEQSRIHRDLISLAGLFTARSGEASWGVAHRVLAPAFGPFQIRKMFGKMVVCKRHSMWILPKSLSVSQDISSQLILKWDRESQANPDYEILCSDDFTISHPVLLLSGPRADVPIQACF